MDRHKAGHGYKENSNVLLIPRSTVKSIIKNWQVFGTTGTGSGRPSKLDVNARRKLILEATKRPMTTLKELQDFMANVGGCVHVTTISKGMVAKKPIIM